MTKVLFHFEALEDFFSEELQSQYVKGLSYSVRTLDAKLIEESAKWLAEGKIKMVQRIEAQISGHDGVAVAMFASAEAPAAFASAVGVGYDEEEDVPVLLTVA